MTEHVSKDFCETFDLYSVFLLLLLVGIEELLLMLRYFSLSMLICSLEFPAPPLLYEPTGEKEDQEKIHITNGVCGSLISITPLVPTCRFSLFYSPIIHFDPKVYVIGEWHRKAPTINGPLLKTKFFLEKVVLDREETLPKVRSIYRFDKRTNEFWVWIYNDN